MNKKMLLAIIITAIICISGTAIASTTLLAKDIKFTPSNSNWNVSTVEDALNDLNDSMVYETGTVSFYLAYNASYKLISFDLNNTYTEDDHAVVVFTGCDTVGPIYPSKDFSIEYIVGNTASGYIFNMAGDSKYSKTYTLSYSIINKDKLLGN